MRFDATSTRSPVLGLRAVCGSRLRRRKLPKPRSSTFSPRCSVFHDAAEHGVNDDLGALLRQAGGVGHLLDERRLRQAAVGHLGRLWLDRRRGGHRGPAVPAAGGMIAAAGRVRPGQTARRAVSTARPNRARRHAVRPSRGRGGRSPRQRVVLRSCAPPSLRCRLVPRRRSLWELQVFAVALDALVLGDGERVGQGVTPTAGRSRGRRCAAGCGKRPR